MDRYLIETPHTAWECLDLIKLLNAQGYLWNFDWGCKAGVHSGWAIIDAENEAQARLVVPPLVRNRARIIKLNKFDATSIEDYEKQEAVAARSGGRLAEAGEQVAADGKSKGDHGHCTHLYPKAVF